MDPINLEGEIHTKPQPHPPHIPNGPDGNTNTNHNKPTLTENKTKTQTDILRDSFKENIRLADDINMDLLTKEISGPGGSLLWMALEIAKRMITPTEIGSHPLEIPDTTFDAYKGDRMLRLRKELLEEIENTKKANTNDQSHTEPERAFSIKELFLINAGACISPECKEVTTQILRYGRPQSNPRLPLPSKALTSFLRDAKVPAANACWCKETGYAYMIPYTQPGKPCTGYYPNGTIAPTNGIAVMKPLGNVCKTSFGTCPLFKWDIVGAPCWCPDPYNPTVPYWPGVVISTHPGNL